MIRLTGDDRTFAINAWSKIPAEQRDVMLEILERQDRRAACCEPYDCMCHEQCNEEYGYCNGCKEGAGLWKLAGEHAPIVWTLAREIVDDEAQTVVDYELQMIRELEAVGDYAAAERLMEAS